MWAFSCALGGDVPWVSGQEGERLLEWNLNCDCLCAYAVIAFLSEFFLASDVPVSSAFIKADKNSSAIDVA